MLTAVGKLIVLMSTQVIPGAGIGLSAIVEFKNPLDGSTYYTNGYAQATNMGFMAGSITYNNSGVYVGSGSTPATESDWELETPILGNKLTGSFTTSYSVNSDKNVMYVNYDYVLTNLTQEDITIREIGRTTLVATNPTKGEAVQTGTTYKKPVLVDRTVLETPVVIPAGEAATVRYQFVYDAS